MTTPTECSKPNTIPASISKNGITQIVGWANTACTGLHGGTMQLSIKRYALPQEPGQPERKLTGNGLWVRSLAGFVTG